MVENWALWRPLCLRSAVRNELSRCALGMKLVAVGATIWLGPAGCSEPPRQDVLQEFPPPRLANEIPTQHGVSRRMAVSGSVLSMCCTGDGEEAFRSEAGDGHFTITHDTHVDVQGEFQADLAIATLQSSLIEEMKERSAGATSFSWRILDIRKATTSLPQRQPSSQGERTVLTALTEVEFNAVRTRHLQTLVLIRDVTSGDGAQLSWERPLALDASTHALHSLASRPRRTELRLDVTLVTPSSQAQEVGQKRAKTDVGR